jgi:uncharacterized membrane protein
MEIGGVPLHPLVVHAVVVLAPLAALLAIAYAVRPGWRWALRWPMVLLAAVAAASGVIAEGSGEDLLHTLSAALRDRAVMEDHEQLGEQLKAMLMLFAVVSFIAAWRLGGASGAVSGRGARTQHGGVLSLILSGLLILAAIGVLALTFLAGHSGASSVWG